MAKGFRLDEPDCAAALQLQHSQQRSRRNEHEVKEKCRTNGINAVRFFKK